MVESLFIDSFLLHPMAINLARLLLYHPVCLISLHLTNHIDVRCCNWKCSLVTFEKKKRIFNSIFFATPLFAMHCYSLYIKPIANESHHSWFMNPTQYVNTTIVWTEVWNLMHWLLMLTSLTLTHGHANMPYFWGQSYWYCPLQLSFIDLMLSSMVKLDAMR